jgi:hypothetical protein
VSEFFGGLFGVAILGLVGAFWFFLIKALVFITSCGEGYVKTFALAFPPVACVAGYQP